jgi:hypothetical protein
LVAVVGVFKSKGGGDDDNAAVPTTTIPSLFSFCVAVLIQQPTTDCFIVVSFLLRLGCLGGVFDSGDSWDDGGM